MFVGILLGTIWYINDENENRVETTVENKRPSDTNSGVYLSMAWKKGPTSK